jgi:hypothetical protein
LIAGLSIVTSGVTVSWTAEGDFELSDLQLEPWISDYYKAYLSANPDKD